MAVPAAAQPTSGRKSSSFDQSPCCRAFCCFETPRSGTRVALNLEVTLFFFVCCVARRASSTVDLTACRSMQSLHHELGSVPRVADASEIKRHARTVSRSARRAAPVRAATPALTPKGTVMDDQVELGKTGSADVASMGVRDLACSSTALKFCSSAKWPTLANYVQA